jgi:hypothetical protein
MKNIEKEFARVSALKIEQYDKGHYVYIKMLVISSIYIRT